LGLNKSENHVDAALDEYLGREPASVLPEVTSEQVSEEIVEIQSEQIQEIPVAQQAVEEPEGISPKISTYAY
jgi:hypothetical protein